MFVPSCYDLKYCTDGAINNECFEAEVCTTGYEAAKLVQQVQPLYVR